MPTKKFRILVKMVEGTEVLDKPLADVESPKAPEVRPERRVLDKTEFEDSLGIKREVYQFKTKEGYSIDVIFRPCEDLPGPEIFKDRETFLLGKKPSYHEPDDYENFIKTISPEKIHVRQGFSGLPHERDILASGNSIFCLETSSPESIMDLAIILGANDPKIITFRENMHNRVYTPEINEILDLIIAGDVVNNKGELDLEETTHDGEALMLKSLLGDLEAKKILEERKIVIDQLEEERRRKETEEIEAVKNQPELNEEYADVEPAKVEDIMVCQLTNFYPLYDEKTKEWYLQSTFDATAGKGPRNTVHFTLNHPVADHESGQWNTKEIAILAPLKSMIETNGLMTNLNAIDTFWTIAPGGRLKLPQDAIIIAPGFVTQEKSWDWSDGGMRHKGPDKGIHKINYHLIQDKHDKTNLREEVYKVFKNQNYKTYTGSNFYVQENEFNYQIAELSSELGVSAVAHTHHLSSEFEHRLSATGLSERGFSYLNYVRDMSEVVKKFSQLSTAEIDGKMGEFFKVEKPTWEQKQFYEDLKIYEQGWWGVDHLRYKIREEYFKELPPELKRVVYLVGIL